MGSGVIHLRASLNWDTWMNGADHVRQHLNRLKTSGDFWNEGITSARDAQIKLLLQHRLVVRNHGQMAVLAALMNECQHVVDVVANLLIENRRELGERQHAKAGSGTLTAWQDGATEMHQIDDITPTANQENAIMQ